MIDKYDALRAGIYYEVFETLEPLLEDIGELIEQNPFSERIKYLLERPSLSRIPVLNLHDEMSPPNCLGTSFWIADVGKLDYPYHAYSYELDEHMGKTENSAKSLFNSNLERRISGAFCFSFDTRIEGWHSGIYLGTIGKEHILFGQHGHGKDFGLETEWVFVCPEYYIPRSLKKD